MRKLREVSKEIETIINESGRISDCNYKRKIQKRVEFLKQMQFYLETNPTIDFLQKQYDKLSSKIDCIDKEYFDNYEWASKLDAITRRKTRNTFDEMYDVKKIKNQIIALKYLLKK